jgi:CheY-like chemotaxis protein
MGESEKPDLIIMDLMLPYANGAQVLKSIKKSHFTRDIPVFVLSNYQNPDLQNDLDNNELRPEKYLIKTEHTPAQIMGIIGQHFAAKEVKTNLA